MWLLGVLSVTAQQGDLYDLSHSVAFANYLYHNGEYEMAGKEYYRVFSMTNHHDSIAVKLGNSLLHTHQYPKITRIFSSAYGNDKIPCSVSHIYAKGLIMSHSAPSASEWINQTTCFTEEEKRYFTISNKLLHYQFKEAATTYNSYGESSALVQRYEKVFKQIAQKKSKKVWTSVLLSSLLPGAGKVYCGEWKDGLFSFAMFGLSFWQAYAGFHKKGVKSIYGWINGGLALAFYSGNIYGSIKSVHKYNYHIEQEIHHEAQEVFLLPD